jgi:hypothetical protein
MTIVHADVREVRDALCAQPRTSRMVHGLPIAVYLFRARLRDGSVRVLVVSSLCAAVV